MVHKVADQRFRSVVKAVTYRILIIISNAVIVYSLTGSISLTIDTLVLSSLSSSLIYYIHERVWNHIHWGRTPISKNLV